MIAENILSHTLPILKPSDTVKTALSLMAHEHVGWLPVVDQLHYLGMISEDVLLEQTQSKKISSLKLTNEEVFVISNQHYFEALKILFEHQVGSVSVLNLNKEYIGSITNQDLVGYITNIGFIKSPGGILVLSVMQNNYSLSEISRIIENSDMKAICLYTSGLIEDTLEIAITIKLDKLDLTRLMASFERYGYKIIAHFHESDFKYIDSDRFDQLMKYLSF